MAQLWLSLRTLTAMAFTFTKEERLCNKALIAKLFDKGNRGFSQFPFRFLWVENTLPSSFPVQVLITVSRRNFPAAVHRNRIKRQVRELYRLRKHSLCDSARVSGRNFALLISFTGKNRPSHEALVPVFDQCIQRLKAEFEKDRSLSVPRADQGV